MHIKTEPEDEKPSEIGIACSKSATFFSGVTKVFSGVTKVDVPADANIMVFIDKPQEPEKVRRGVRQSKTADA